LIFKRSFGIHELQTHCAKLLCWWLHLRGNSATNVTKLRSYDIDWNFLP